MARPVGVPVSVSDYLTSVIGGYGPMATVSFYQDNCKSLVTENENENENYMFGLCFTFR
jgi:hypothetical protein